LAAERRADGVALRVAARWLGAAVVVALLVAVGGFSLLKDYKKVRVLRTVEHWVTEAEAAAAAAPGR
jgi:hypothetical protein